MKKPIILLFVVFFAIIFSTNSNLFAQDLALIRKFFTIKPYSKENANITTADLQNALKKPHVDQNVAWTAFQQQNPSPKSKQYFAYSVKSFELPASISVVILERKADQPADEFRITMLSYNKKTGKFISGENIGRFNKKTPTKAILEQTVIDQVSYKKQFTRPNEAPAVMLRFCGDCDKTTPEERKEVRIVIYKDGKMDSMRL